MAVLNDFEACGYGVPALQPEDLLVLNDVPARQKVSPLQRQHRTEPSIVGTPRCVSPQLHPLPHSHSTAA